MARKPWTYLFAAMAIKHMWANQSWSAAAASYLLIRHPWLQHAPASTVHYTAVRTWAIVIAIATEKMDWRGCCECGRSKR